jgi:hypothetical protein
MGIWNGEKVVYDLRCYGICNRTCCNTFNLMDVEAPHVHAMSMCRQLPEPRRASPPEFSRLMSPLPMCDAKVPRQQCEV